MAQPPRKRQKQLVVLSSSDVDDNATDCVERSPEKKRKVLATRPKTNDTLKPRQFASQGSTKSTPASSPKKPTKSTRSEKPKSKEQRSGSLFSFFNAKTESQRGLDATELSQTKPQAKKAVVELDDIIEDDSTENEQSISSQSRHNPPSTVPPGKHTSRSTQTTRAAISGPSISPVPQRSSSQSQRFSKPVLRSDDVLRKPVDRYGDKRPWAERYGPSNLEELAVHKKKVVDVRGWIQSTFDGRHRHRLLVLKGPSGTGKTATLTTLSKAMGFEIAEWQNPSSTGFASDASLSPSTIFDDFLAAGGKYSSLEFNTSIPATTQTDRDLENQPRNKVILIEDFPNTFTQNSTALHSFRASILQYIQTQPNTPLVLVISETLLSSTTSASDSFTAHRLLGPDILISPFTTLIEYNPIAPTFLAKALDLVIQKEARDSGRRRTPGAALLRKLGEVGDVRSAIGSLEFLCVRDDASSDWGGRVAAAGKGRKGNAKEAAMTKMERESVEMVTQREATLGIFHAVGKVVYNKRSEERQEPSFAVSDEPRHLKHYHRPPLQNLDLNTLSEETGTDTSTFIAALHENYALSCPDTDTLNGCLEALSDADILSSAHLSSASQNSLLRKTLAGSNYNPSAVDNLRQEEIAFHVAVRGLLFALPENVKREANPGEKGKGDRYRMFYPMSLKLWRAAEEIGEAVARWRDESWGLGLGGGGGGRGTAGGVDGDEGVESWARRAGGVFGNAGVPEGGENEEGGYKRQGTSSRAEMLLERLPFLAMIKPLGGEGSSREGKELRRITRFEGVGVAVVEEEEEEEEGDELGGRDAMFELRVEGVKNVSERDEQGLEALGVGSLALVEDDIEDIED